MRRTSILLAIALVGCPQPGSDAPIDDDDAAEECVDEDGDGQCAGPDCDDQDPDVRPNTAERTCDDVDNDCDPSTPDAPDEDLDGSTVCEDCDDGDPDRAPGAAEVTCDDVDNDCDDATLDRPDQDDDGASTCEDCDDADPSRYPGAPAACSGVDNDCDGALSEDEAAEPGTSAACAIDGLCADLLAALGDPEDGLYWVGDDASGPFRVQCSFEGGVGRLLLEPTGSQGVYVAEHSAGNAWSKCADEAAEWFSWIASEDEVTPDHSAGFTDLNINLAYRSPESGQTLSAAQMEFLRARVIGYDATTRMVAVTADDDSLDWDGGANGGHEVYVDAGDGAWFNLTPGTNGECGGASNWPTVGSESAFYLWHPTPGSCAVAGNTGGTTGGMLGGLPGSLLLPARVRLVVQTGGGVAFGWEHPVVGLR